MAATLRWLLDDGGRGWRIGQRRHANSLVGLRSRGLVFDWTEDGLRRWHLTSAGRQLAATLTEEPATSRSDHDGRKRSA